MSVHTDSIPVFPANAQVSRKQAKKALRARGDRDLELLQRVGRGDAEAAATLAERIAPRVERIARALMGGSLDADDAALHALVELLRSPETYRGKEPLERWVDRGSALSVVRFARAVSRRSGPCITSEGAPERRHDERSARTFEQYLQTLSDATRQTLLLRHALGFELSELADALKVSASSAKEQLLVARGELRSLVRRKDGVAAQLGQGAERWCALRDREALGERLRNEELEELGTLEKRDPEIWALVAQVRALELYFEAGRTPPSTLGDGTLVARAIAAVRVTTPPAAPRVDPLAAPSKPRDLDGSRVIRGLAIASSVALALATAYALMVYQPTRRALTADDDVSARRELPSAPAAQVALRPTVEALPRVSTMQRGGKLRREGRLLAAGTLLAQGDAVETLDRAGCLHIEPDSEVCLAPSSALKLVSVSARQRTLELGRGRVVVRVGAQSESSRIVLRAGELEVASGRAVFGVERTLDGKLVRVRSLRGPVDVLSGVESRRLDDNKSAVSRAPGTLEVVPLLPSFAQRDWEVLATGLHAAAPRPVPAAPAAGTSATSVVPRDTTATPPAPSVDQDERRLPSDTLEANDLDDLLLGR